MKFTIFGYRWFYNPYERGDFVLLFVREVNACFNPRPYERGDLFALGEVEFTGVSIHAPMRGATLTK